MDVAYINKFEKFKTHHNDISVYVIKERLRDFRKIIPNIQDNRSKFIVNKVMTVG